MIPVLFPPDERDFTTQGLGALSAAISCTVTEERNGIYELELVYPVIGIHYGEIAKRCIIWAIPSPYRDPQPFRIYRHTKPLAGRVTFYARHISYDLQGVPLNPCGAGSVAAAMVALETNVATPSPFTYWTDKSTEADWSVTVPSVSRAVLGGQEGSILDVYGGEYEWDRFVVKLYHQRGRDNGVTIRYGKNLTDITEDSDDSNLATGIYPFWTDSEGGNLVVCDPPIVPAPGTYDFTRITTVDFSGEWDEPPTPEQLQARAETYVVANQIGVPKVRLAVSFVQLEQTLDFADLRLLEKVDLCDTVTVQYEALGVDATAKVIRIETDVLRERYNEVELGDARGSLADTIINQGQQIQQKPSKSDLQQAVSGATDLITGAKGGNIRIMYNGAGLPYEQVILDTQDITTAQNVWRWNVGGFGHSSAGYNGEYTTAITQDGHIVADFVDVGTLNANILQAGVIRSQDGLSWWNLETGEVQFSTMASQSDLDDLKDQVAQGVDHVDARNGCYFGPQGMTVTKTDAEISTTVDFSGMRVVQVESGQVLLSAQGNQVTAANLHASTYLIVGGRSRFENFGENYTGCFWIKGGQ